MGGVGGWVVTWVDGWMDVSGMAIDFLGGTHPIYIFRERERESWHTS